MPQCRLDRDRAAEGLSEEHKPIGRESSLGRRPGDRLAVRKEALFARLPGALSVAAVVHEKDVETKRFDEDSDTLEPVADVSGVAVEKEQGLPACAMDPPSLEPHAAARLERECLRRQPEVLGPRVVLSLREVDEARLEFAEHQNENPRSQQDRQRNPHYSRTTPAAARIPGVQGAHAPPARGCPPNAASALLCDGLGRAGDLLVPRTPGDGRRRRASLPRRKISIADNVLATAVVDSLSQRSSEQCVACVSARVIIRATIR